MLSSVVILQPMANENQWHFPTYTGAQPQTPARAIQQYTAVPYQYPPASYLTPEPYRPPLQPMQTPYANPLQQMLPMPQSTPRTPRREDGEDRPNVFAPGYFAGEERDLASGDEGTEDNGHFGGVAHVDDNPVGRVEGDRVELRVEGDRAARVKPRVEVEVVKPKGRSTAKSKKDTVGDEKKAKRTGRGSRSGALNRREVGASDDEIEELSKKNVKEAAVKFKNEGWTDDKKLRVLKYITSDKVWQDWKVNQAKEFLNVSFLRFSRGI